MTTPSPIELAAQIVSAYAANNELDEGALPNLIQDIHRTLASLESGLPIEKKKATPAVHPRESVFPDYVICLEDGKKLKLLKRYLMTRYNLTPADYRAKWGLPKEYPMVAPNYAGRRSALAKASGLGRIGQAQDVD